MERQVSVRDPNDAQSLLYMFLDTILLPFRALISLPARRLYLRSALLLISIPVLAFFAVAAYISFYQSYIPERSFSVPIYLQFNPDQAHHPHGVAPLSTSFSGSVSPLMSQQAYDISLHMTFPRSPTNLEAGNFMLTLDMLGPGNGSSDLPGSDPVTYPVLATSSRPAILTYRSDMVRRASTLVGLVPYTIGWSREDESINLWMMEAWITDRSSRNLPTGVRVEVQSKGMNLEIYDVLVEFKARFSGLRWLMHNYRIISFISFSTTFFAIETFAMLAVYFLFTYIFSSRTSTPNAEGPDQAARIKSEQDEDTELSFSDTSRVFPTSSRQPPLRYSSGTNRIKTEEEEKEDFDDEDDTIIKTEPPADADVEDAADEDEDADFVLDSTLSPTGAVPGGRSDSGLGTSLESSNPSGGTIRRRTSGGKLH